MNNNIKYKIDILYGISIPKSWIETQIDSKGNIMLIGMGSRTDYDLYGNIVYHKCEPTGITGTLFAK